MKGNAVDLLAQGHTYGREWDQNTSGVARERGQNGISGKRR